MQFPVSSIPIPHNAAAAAQVRSLHRRAVPFASLSFADDDFRPLILLHFHSAIRIIQVETRTGNPAGARSVDVLGHQFNCNRILTALLL